jgi:prepilin-type N-terminal cleavage/methylation domain-containing protein
MISLKKRNQGFTIVELLIVIVVIGILALLVITTYSGIQQKARNNTRQANLGAIQTQLEIYYQNNGFYPSLTDMNTGTSATTNAASTFVTANMKNLDQNALVDPSNGSQSKHLGSSPAAKVYSYEPAQADGTTGSSTVVKSNLD